MKRNKSPYLLIALMLFSMFFGAGNLIFPPMVGKEAGSQTSVTMLFFAVTAVLLPVLGVIAVAKTDGLRNLGDRVGTRFSKVFTVIIYLSIGPLLAIPRAGSVPYAFAIEPYIANNSVFASFGLFLYSELFFAICYWLSISPGKLMERSGKYLTPALLLMMILLFVGVLFRPLGAVLPPTGNYVEHAPIQGFLDGYSTMDTLAGLNFGLVVAMTLRSLHVTDPRQMIAMTRKSGILAGTILFMVYAMLSFIGATGAGLIPDATNGAQIIGFAATRSFGNVGFVLLAAIFTLACITTCIGLITSCSDYFAEWYPVLSYKGWVRVWTLLSLVLANAGLDTILRYNVPVLFAIYPVSITLIVLALLGISKKAGLVYRLPIYTVAVFSVIDALKVLSIEFSVLRPIIDKIPLYDLGLGWVIPGIVAFAIGVIWTVIQGNPLREKLIS